MYKCKECLKEYKEKPDYCDCGNDSFDEIIEEKKQTKTNKNLLSIIFLIICIVLSFIILFFIGNPKNEPDKKEEKKVELKNLPEIDELWDDTKPKMISEQTSKQVIQKPKENIEPPKITKVELKKEDKKPIISIPKIKNSFQTKKPQQIAKINTVQQTTKVSKPQIQNNNKVVIQKPAQNAPQTTTQKQPTQTIQSNKTQPAQTKPAQQEIKPQENNVVIVPKVNPEELKQYKRALRQKIASNIDFLSIAGDGKCVLSFNISSNGALLNKKFISQSQNTSLNDAVYKAMMNLTSFKTPPAGYKNETLKLTVKITGGNFEVILE